MASPKTCNSSSRPSIQQMYETVQPYTNNTSQVSSLVEWLYYKVGGVNKIKNPYLLGKGSFGAVFVLPGNPCIVLKVVQFKGNGGLAEKTSFRNEVKKALVGSQYYDNFIKNYVEECIMFLQKNWSTSDLPKLLNNNRDLCQAVESEIAVRFVKGYCCEEDMKRVISE